VRADELNSFSRLLERYRACLTRLERNDTRIAATSRLRAYEARLTMLAEGDASAPVSEQVVNTTAFDVRETDEIIEIVENLPNALDVSINSLLTKLHKGTQNPDEEASAAARDAQYELYLGSVLRRAGLEPQHGSPDLAVIWNGTTYCIEAKRPGSVSRVDDLLRAAVQQLERLPAGGIVALSLDQVLRPEGQLLTARHPNHIARAIVDLMDKFLGQHQQMFAARLRNRKVLGVLLTARIPGRLLPSGHTTLGSQLHLEVFDGTPDQRSAEQFLRWVAERYFAAQRTETSATDFVRDYENSD
jgi:hypothetical protein